MKCLRILPEMWAKTLREPGRSTRNIVPGKTCVTVPSVTICSSFGTEHHRQRTGLSQPNGALTPAHDPDPAHNPLLGGDPIKDQEQDHDQEQEMKLLWPHD